MVQQFSFLLKLQCVCVNYWEVKLKRRVWQKKIWQSENEESFAKILTPDIPVFSPFLFLLALLPPSPVCLTPTLIFYQIPFHKLKYIIFMSLQSSVLYWILQYINHLLWDFSPLHTSHYILMFIDFLRPVLSAWAISKPKPKPNSVFFMFYSVLVHNIC